MSAYDPLKTFVAQMIGELLAYLMAELGAEHVREKYGTGGC
jgi:hypothetical protein